jgi:hypothetical protein
MYWLRSVLSRFRGALIYTSICVVVLLALYDRAWNHVATLNGDEWGSVQAFLRDNRRPEEPICFLPTWTIGHATDQRKFRGMELIEHPADAWEEGSGPLSGFWVVSQFGAFDAGRVPEEHYPHRIHIQLGGADIYGFRATPIQLERSLYLRVQEAQCTLVGPNDSKRELVWSRTGFVLPGGFARQKRLSYLGCRPTEGQFAGRSRPGIWFHPPPRDSRLKMTWPRLELEQRWLAVSGGLRDQIATRSSPPINFEVSLDGKSLRRYSFPSKRGWSTFAVDLGSEAGLGRVGALSFEVWAQRNHSRHFIFNASFAETRPDEDSPRRIKGEENRARSRRLQRKNDDDDDSGGMDLELRAEEREGRSDTSSGPVESDGGGSGSNESGEEG